MGRRMNWDRVRKENLSRARGSEWDASDKPETGEQEKEEAIRQNEDLPTLQDAFARNDIPFGALHR